MDNIIRICVIVTPVVVSLAVNKINLVRLNHKDFMIKDISEIGNTAHLEAKHIDIDSNYLDSMNKKDIVLDFANIVMQKFTKEQLINFYNNINDVKIKKDNELSLIKVRGYYNPRTNIINYCSSSSLYHELFHLASSTYNSETDLYYTGFEQCNYKWLLGKGINEGYTEVMTYRYFKSEISSYYLETHVAECLDIIVGQKEMENLYLSSNLMGLINILKKYATEEDIMKFICRLDYFTIHSKGNHNYKSKKLETAIQNVFSFLLKTYINKLEQEYDREDFIFLLERFYDKVNGGIRLYNHRYYFLTEEDKKLVNDYYTNFYKNFCHSFILEFKNETK